MTYYDMLYSDQLQSAMWQFQCGSVGPLARFQERSPGPFKTKSGFHTVHPSMAWLALACAVGNFPWNFGSLQEKLGRACMSPDWGCAKLYWQVPVCLPRR